MRIFPTPRYQDVPELLDSLADVSENDLRTTLRDIRRANIFGFGTWVVKRHLKDMLRDTPRDKPLYILDIATGSGDIPEELCRWARREKRDIAFVISDISPEILEVARKRIEGAGFGERVAYVVCDAANVPFAPCSFDVVICSLAFHHLDLRQAIRAVREMKRLSRIGFIINDIYRSQGAWYMAWVLTHLTTSNRLTRHDGPASVLRAFTPAELRRMSNMVGIEAVVHKHPFWRTALVGRREL
ncbi:MAG: methyltransferase domain-containing protein [Chloroflexia bacterium]